MSKFGRKKMALALACASILGGKTQAMDKNKLQSQQTLAAVGGVTGKNQNAGFVNWVKNHKLGVGVGGALTVATAVTLTILGVKHGGKKDSGGKPNEKPDIKENVNAKGNKAEVKVDNLDSSKIDNKKSNTKKRLFSQSFVENQSKIIQNQMEIIRKSEKSSVTNPQIGNLINIDPVIEIKVKEKSIIEKNIERIKGNSNDIAPETVELFFDKVKSILDKKDQLVAGVVKEVSKFSEEQGKFIEMSEDEELDEKYIEKLIEDVVKNTNESLYNKEVNMYSSRLRVYGGCWELFLGGNDLISISADGKELCLRNYNYGIKFDISSLNIGELKVAQIKLTNE